MNQQKIVPKKKIAKDTVQPTPHLDRSTAPETPEIGNGSGSGSGSGSGDPRDPGTCLVPPCGESEKPADPPPPPPAQPVIQQVQVVPPTVLRGLRVAGDTQIEPPDTVKTAIAREGKDRTIAMFKICLGLAGEITSSSLVRTSGYEAYDRRLAEGIASWRYRPFTVNGVPAPVCSMVTFIYSMK